MVGGGRVGGVAVTRVGRNVDRGAVHLRHVASVASVVASVASVVACVASVDGVEGVSDYTNVVRVTGGEGIGDGEPRGDLADGVGLGFGVGRPLAVAVEGGDGVAIVARVDCWVVEAGAVHLGLVDGLDRENELSMLPAMVRSITWL